MKIACTQENLSHGLSLVSGIAGKHPHLPILNNILLQADKEGLTLAATNLEIGIKTKIRGKVDEEGSFTVQAKLLNDFIHSLDSGNLRLEQKDANLIIENDSQQTKIKGESAQEFPLIPEVMSQQTLAVLAGELVEALEGVLFAASPDDSRPELHAVYCVIKGTEMTLVATDSYRLSEVVVTLQKPVDEQFSLIIPLKTMQQVSKMLQTIKAETEVLIKANDNQIQIEAEQTIITSRLISGQYPDYKQIIPEQFNTTITINGADLTRGLRSASLFCQPGINDVRFLYVPETQEIQLRAQNSTSGDNLTRLEAETKGQAGEIVFNYRYLLEGVLHMKESKVTLELNESSTPSLLRGVGNKKALYLVMPIKQ